MKKYFAFNYHSFVDVITNSSSELFMTTEKKVVEFFQDLLNRSDKRYSAIKVMTYEQFAKDRDFEYMQKEEPECYQERYGNLNKDDMILTIKYDSDDPDFVFELAKLLNMKSLYE